MSNPETPLRFTLSNLLKDSLHDMGLYGNWERRINDMVVSSIPFNRDGYNRRYQGFLFQVQGDEVVDLTRFDPASDRRLGGGSEQVISPVGQAPPKISPLSVQESIAKFFPKKPTQSS